MDLVQNYEFMRINTCHLSYLNLFKLGYIKSGVGLSKIDFLVCPTRMDGPS